jgi:type VI secretion system secreted protein Hcp
MLQTIRNAVFALAAMAAFPCTASALEASAFLKLNGADVPGNSTVVSLGRENSIEVYDFGFGVTAPIDTATGLATGRRFYQTLKIHKRADRSSPLLFRGLAQNQVAELSIRFFRPNPTGDGTTQHYMTYRITGARIVDISATGDSPTLGTSPISGQLREVVSFAFQTFQITYEDGGVTFTDTISGTP